MATRFDAAQARALASIERVRGESFTLLPRMQEGDNVRARTVPDISRPEVTLIGVFTEPHESDAADSPGHAVNRAPRTSTSRPQVAFRLAALPYELRPGDRVRRLDPGHRSQS